MRRIFSPLLCLCLTLAACAADPTAHNAAPADPMIAALCEQGKALLASGKAVEARDLYSSVLHRDDRSARAWNGLGVADYMLGKRDDATDAYKKAIDLAPGDRAALNNLAHLYLEARNYDAAIALLEPYKDSADMPVLQQNLALAYDGRAGQTALQQARESETYADLGSYPTDGMAQAHLAEARRIGGDDLEGVTFLVVPEVKITGGTPTFAVRVTGQSPQAICDVFNPKALPCVPYAK